MKTFDWGLAHESHSHIVVDYLRTVYDKPITEEEFVRGFCSLLKSTPKSKRSPSVAKIQYRRLKTTFGFFGGK